jgi:hypothetical protein
MSYKMEEARLSGALVLVLEDFENEPSPVHILFKERGPMPLKLRVFLDWLIPRLKARLAPQVAPVSAAAAEPAIGGARSASRGLDSKNKCPANRAHTIMRLPTARSRRT